MMQRLIVVRHGQSQHHLNGMTGGWTDLPLTPLGKRQAQDTAQRVAVMLGPAPVSVFSSDLRRACMTAAPIARQLGVQAIVDSGLRELNNGSAAGLTQQQAKALELPKNGSLLDWQHYPGSETWRTMNARVTRCMGELAQRSAQTAVVISHAAACTAVVRWWLRVLDLDAYPLSFEFDPCSITELGQSAWGEPMILRLNDASHLAQPRAKAPAAKRAFTRPGAPTPAARRAPAGSRGR